jgi:hypothetical protein
VLGGRKQEAHEESITIVTSARSTGLSLTSESPASCTSLIIVRARLGVPRGKPGTPHDTCEFRFHARRAVARSTSPTCAYGVVAVG